LKKDNIFMENLDRQLYRYSGRLKEDVGIDKIHLNSICSKIYSELGVKS